jgi:RHH-type transcriptional regulator, proline utilization regulon repressor / proline dehydrogenase / delta 1-pyrroline-5-carboxylate dehydrogenase
VSLAPFANEPMLELRRASQRTALLEALVATDSRLPLKVPVLVGSDRGSAEGLVSHDPGAPERCVAQAGAATDADVDAAVTRAAAAAPAWAGLAAAERAQILLRGADILRGRRLELAALEVRECAKPWEEADADVCEAIDYLEYYARAAVALDQGRTLLAVPGETNTLHYAPRGVTAVISPWNFPVAIPAGMTSAALATGNTVLLKPAEQSPACGLALIEALRAAGVPPDALSLLPGEGSTGAALVRHAAVDTIAFTGSSAVGREILRTAVDTSTRQLKRVVAERGGKNCIIVDVDADLDEAVPALLRSAFSYAGQKCSACSRILVHEGVAAELERRLRGALRTLAVGQAQDFASEVPPLIEAAAQDRVRRATELAETEGRILARGARGPSGGWFCEPAIAADLPGDSSLLHEEIFGPLVSFEVAPDLEAACATVEALPYALTAGLFSRNPASVAQVTARLPAGNLYVNRHITGALVGRQPFGGNRMSGLGYKAGGPDYLLQFVEARVVTENTMRHGLTLG